MYGLTSIFDNWRTQVRGWPTDYAGGMCAWEFLDTCTPATQYTYVCNLAKYIAARYKFEPLASVKSERSLLPIKEFPSNVYIYANDILKLDIDEFKTCDLEYQFQLEEEAGVPI